MFASFAEMMGADRYRLAADAFLGTFAAGPDVPLHQLSTLLESWCAEKAPSFLGLGTRTVPELVACQQRCLLIWERSLAASSYLVGRENPREQLILIEPGLMRMSPPQLAQHFAQG